MLTYMLVVLPVITLTGFFYYINSGPKMPPGTNEVIDQVLAEDLPELVTGKVGYATSGALKIWYEVMPQMGTRKGTILLVMGHNSTAMLWTPKFYQPFLDAGYEVIRYDNRDVGLSTWINDYKRNQPYTLEDMARDGIAVLDEVGVHRAHVMGVSMGGMIAQRMAISHSDRILSLTSIMSTGFMMDPEIAPVPKWFLQNFIKLGLRYLTPPTDRGSIKFFIGILETLKGDGPYELDVKLAAQIMLYETRKRRGFNKKAIRQQAWAIEASGSRLEELGSVNLPTLVVHGKADPLIIFDHAKKYAHRFPNGEALFIEGMGHDLPEIYLGTIHERVFGILEKTGVVH